jgi:hypothetical protein
MAHCLSSLLKYVKYLLFLNGFGDRSKCGSNCSQVVADLQAESAADGTCSHSAGIYKSWSAEIHRSMMEATISFNS